MPEQNVVLRQRKQHMLALKTWTNDKLLDLPCPLPSQTKIYTRPYREPTRQAQDVQETLMK